MTTDSTLSFETELRTAPEAAFWTVFDVPDSAEFFGTRQPVRVRGVVDDLPVEITLMPTKNGHVGPVKAATRKALGKQAGDHVHVRIEEVRA